MATIEIDIDEYLSESDKKQIAIDTFASIIASKFKDEKEIERILYNSCYHEIDNAVDAVVPNYKQMIVDKTVEIIEKGVPEYRVFRSKDHWNQASLATQIVEDTVKANTDIIKSRVLEAMKSKDFSKEILDEVAVVIDGMYNYTTDVIAKMSDIFSDLKGESKTNH